MTGQDRRTPAATGDRVQSTSPSGAGQGSGRAPDQPPGTFSGQAPRRAGSPGDPAEGARDGVTLADVLRLEPLREVKVLAGHRSLNRPVRLVNVIEVPDIVDWVLEGELLLTTGFTFRDDPGHLAALIPGLAAKGAAGLGIKPRRYMGEIPAEAVTQAERHGLPLLEIPYHLSFAEVIGPVMQAIVHRQAAATLAADRLQRELLDLVLRGAGLDELCTAVARSLSRPVWIEDATGAVVAHAEPAPSENLPDAPDDALCVTPSDALPGAQPAALPGPPSAPLSGTPPAAPSGDRADALPDAPPGARALPGGPPDAPADAPPGSAPGTAPGTSADAPAPVPAPASGAGRAPGPSPAKAPDPGAGPAWRVPITSGSRFFGSLCAASPGRAPLPGEAGLLERGAAILALEWGKQAAVVEIQRRYRKEFLDRLLSGDVQHPAEIVERSRALGWALDRPHTVVVFGTVATRTARPTPWRSPARPGRTHPPARGGRSPRDESGPGRELQPLLRAVEMVLSMEGGEPVVGIRDGLVVALVPGDPADPSGRHRILTVAKAVLRSYASSTGAARGPRGPLPAAGLAASAPETVPAGGSRGPGGGTSATGGPGGGTATAAGEPVPAAAAGVGRVAPQPAALASSYREARTALQAARATAAARGTGDGRGGAPGASREPVQFFADLGILRLLHHQPPEELAGFVADHLGALLAYDRRHDGKLLDTLEAYFRYGGNMKRMARALYTHYNTVAYRLQRIRQITGFNLKNPDHLLSLQVALHALPLLDGPASWEEPARGPHGPASGGPGRGS